MRHSASISYFWSKVNIWNVNCAWATAFIFDTRTDVLVKVSKLLRQKMYQPEGDSNPNLPTIWAIRARHLLPHLFFQRDTNPNIPPPPPPPPPPTHTHTHTHHPPTPNPQPTTPPPRKQSYPSDILEMCIHMIALHLIDYLKILSNSFSQNQMFVFVLHFAYVRFWGEMTPHSLR